MPISKQLILGRSNLPLGDVHLHLSDARYEIGQLWKKKFDSVVRDIRRLVEIVHAWDDKYFPGETASKNPLDDGDHFIKKFEKKFAEVQSTAKSDARIKRRSVDDQIRQEVYSIEQMKTTNHVWNDDYCKNADKMMPIIFELASMSFIRFEEEFCALHALHQGLPSLSADFHHTCKEVVSLWHQHYAIEKASDLVSQTTNMISVMGKL